MEEIIEQLKAKARATWTGDEGARRAERLETFLRETLSNYSTVLGIPEADILRAIEAKRTYCCVNYYQQAKFPKLVNVTVFETISDVRHAMRSGKFLCPRCNAASTNPTTCNSGADMEPGKRCDWKAWGLFGALGKGLRFVCKETFLGEAVVYEFFPPIPAEEGAESRI